MKIQSLSIIMFSVLIAFMVTACEIKIMPPTNWGDQKPTEGDPVPLEAQVSLDKIAVGVVKDGWETIAVTAMDERGEPDNNWTVRSVNETIATVQRAKKQITVKGVNLGKTELEITSTSGVKRNVQVRVYSPSQHYWLLQKMLLSKPAAGTAALRSAVQAIFLCCTNRILKSYQPT